MRSAFGLGLHIAQSPARINSCSKRRTAAPSRQTARVAQSNDAEINATPTRASADVDPGPPVERSPFETSLAVVLAAGAGSRFTEDDHKLLAKVQGKPLVWWAVHHAITAGFDEVLVVEGAVELSGSVPTEASIVRNHDWEDGQSRSLHVAAHYAGQFGFEAMVVGLGDQPFVPPEAWRLIATSESPIAVADFGHHRTPPVRLHGDVWGLLPLDGDEGARQLIRSRPEMVVEIPCPGSSVDVDTPNDLDRVRMNSLRKELGTWT